MEPIKSSPVVVHLAKTTRLGDQFAIYAADLKLIGTGGGGAQIWLSFGGMEKPWKMVISWDLSMKNGGLMGFN